MGVPLAVHACVVPATSGSIEPRWPSLGVCRWLQAQRTSCAVSHRLHMLVGGHRPSPNLGLEGRTTACKRLGGACNRLSIEPRWSCLGLDRWLQVQGTSFACLHRLRMPVRGQQASLNLGLDGSPTGRTRLCGACNKRANRAQVAISGSLQVVASAKDVVCSPPQRPHARGGPPT